MQVVQCSQGEVPIHQLFGKQAQALVSKLNIEGQHRLVPLLLPSSLVSLSLECLPVLHCVWQQMRTGSGPGR
jgi:hypothetical protein